MLNLLLEAKSFHLIGETPLFCSFTSFVYVIINSNAKFDDFEDDGYSYKEAV